jgi:hypothetical protein
VQPGDVIGAVSIGDCAPVKAYCAAGGVGGYLSAPGDVGSVVDTPASSVNGCQLAMQGTGVATESEEVLKGVLPVVGSAQGGFGSFFRTSIQISYPADAGAAPISGRLVFHRAGVEGSPDDPSLPFVLQPNQVFSTTDVLAAIGLSGVGSMDIRGFDSEPMPIVSARVYNDAGDAGTSGLSEPVIRWSSDAVDAGRPGYLITPVDPSRTRFNIGVRTLAPASVTFTLFDSTGAAAASATKSYPSNFFEQFGAESLLGPIGSGQLIRLESNGQVIVYGSTTDNTTNDPSMQMAVVP